MKIAHPENLHDSLKRNTEPCLTLEELAAFGRDPSATSEVSRHLAICAVCSHEVEMARAALTLSAKDASVPDPRVHSIVNKLKASPAWRESLPTARSHASGSGPSISDSPKVFRFPTRWLPIVQLAAAAALATIGLLTWFDPAPRLPAPGKAVPRGGSLTVEGPVGSLEQAPAKLQWEHTEEATRYQATLRDVRHQVLFECLVDSGSSSTLSCQLDESVHLEPFVRYSWRVVGLKPHEDGQEKALEVARSPWIFFSFEPAL